jgi:hypothetical protein
VRIPFGGFAGSAFVFAYPSSSDSWLDCEAWPVRSRPILPSRRRDTSPGSPRNGSSPPSGLSTAWTTRCCRGVTTPSGARGRGLALPPAHRRVTTRTRRVLGTFVCRQRPQPSTPVRSVTVREPPTVCDASPGNGPIIPLRDGRGRPARAVASACLREVIPDRRPAD